MRTRKFVAFAALLAASAHLRAQSLQESIVSPDKAVPVVNQTLSGTWLSELRRAGPVGVLPPIPSLVTFFSDGTSLASPSDGTQTAVHGMWTRVGNRKFLGTAYFFSFNESRALTTVTKLRINYQLSSDGKTLTGTTEATVLAPDGRVISTFPGSTISMVRLGLEIPGDFYDFQNLP